MWEKLKAFYNVFRAGESVANPEAWKKGQITGGILATFLGAVVAAAKVFGYDLPLTDEQLAQIGGAVLAVFGLFNAGSTAASSDKVGILPKKDDPTGNGNSQ